MTTKREASKAAAILGKKGGSVKSPAKAASSKANGAKGGRPPSDETIARRAGAEHAAQAFAAGVPKTDHEGDIDAASWDDVCARIGRKVYGYGDEGRALAKAYVKGWDSVAAE